MNIIIPGLLVIIAVTCTIAANDRKKKLNVLDILFAFSIWMAFDTGWWFNFKWSDQASPDLLNPVYMLTSVPVLILVYIYITRRGINIGRISRIKNIPLPSFLKGKVEWKPTLLYTAGAVLVVIPVAYMMGFIQWTPDLRFERMPVRFIEYFLFVGILEEMLFRGLLQNQFVNSFNFKGGKITGILISNLLFAVIYTHLFVPKFPNIEYVALAFLLGLFYAGTYYHSKNIWSSSFLHGFADFLWVTFFMGTG